MVPGRLHDGSMRFAEDLSAPRNHIACFAHGLRWLCPPMELAARLAQGQRLGLFPSTQAANVRLQPHGAEMLL